MKYSQHTRSLQEMPYHEQPTQQYPSFYFKTKTRISQQKQVITIGLQFHRMNRFQEDHILYLIQLFQLQCKQIKVKIIERYLIYGEVHIDIINHLYDPQQYISLQKRLFEMLQICQKCFKTFVKQYINPDKMLMGIEQSFLDELRVNFKEKVTSHVKQFQKKRLFQ